MNHSLNPKKIQTDSLKRESEVDQDHSDNSLVKIDDFSIKIDTVPNLLEVKTKNDSSEESDKILFEEISSDEIIETVHSFDIDTELIIEANLNFISLLKSSESSPGIS